MFTSGTVLMRSARPSTLTHQDNHCTYTKDSLCVSGTKHFLVHEQHLIQWPQHGYCLSGDLHRLPDMEMPELLDVPVFFPVNFQYTQLSTARPGSVWHQAPAGAFLGCWPCQDPGSEWAARPPGWTESVWPQVSFCQWPGWSG